MNWNHFSYETDKMLACPCCGTKGMDDAFMRALDGLRGHLGFPLYVTSGYRCSAYNDLKSKTGRTGPHTTGQAVDVALYGASAYYLLEHAFNYGMMGIGLSQKGDHSKRFVHLDSIVDGPRPGIWTY